MSPTEMKVTEAIDLVLGACPMEKVAKWRGDAVFGQLFSRAHDIGTLRAKVYLLQTILLNFPGIKREDGTFWTDAFDVSLVVRVLIEVLADDDDDPETVDEKENGYVSAAKEAMDALNFPWQRETKEPLKPHLSRKVHRLLRRHNGCFAADRAIELFRSWNLPEWAMPDEEDRPERTHC
jgi:hypothetical protein